jgi:hypothetical protein
MRVFIKPCQLIAIWFGGEVNHAVVNQGNPDASLFLFFCNSPGGLEVVAELCHSREGGNLSMYRSEMLACIQRQKRKILKSLIF